MSAKRVDGESAFVLHMHPYSETSLVVDIFTRNHGRVPLVARGARRPRSAMRGVLMSFQPLELGWFGGGEVKTLAKAEWLGGMPLLGGRCLLLGYYLNELLLKMLPREDPHGALFDAYAAALHALAAGAADAPELRRFEKTLLKELGYGLTLDVELETGRPVVPEREYTYLVERGPVAKVPGSKPGEMNIRYGAGTGDSLAGEASSLCGKTLLDMVADDYSDPRTRLESRQLMRQLITHHMGGKSLQSRRVFMELQEL
ncbi:MAG: DNA repair protein RecO [Burkholderiaceae bacterium]|nr:DNA repair protein RecO [Burkholderiaceae bacterium]